MDPIITKWLETASTKDKRELRELLGDFDRLFYTIPQTAELLQVHENTIYRMVRSGRVAHYKVGAQIRIPALELEKLKVERKVVS